MSDRELLLEGWRRVRFGDVVRQVKDRVDPEVAGIERYVAGEHMETDDLRIRRWGSVGDGYLGPAFHMRFRPGHVLYGSRRTYLRKVALADFEGICANTTFVLETSTDGLLPEFLPLVMTTDAFHGHSIGQSKGSVNPYINYKDLTWYEFPLPPVDQQRRIIAVMTPVLDLADCLIASARSAQAVRDAIYGDAAGAPQCALGDLLTACDYGISAVPATTGDVPMLRMNNLDGEEVVLDDLRWVPLEAVKASDLLQPGDILFNRTNSVEHVGKVGLVEDDLGAVAFASYLIRLRVDRSRVLPAFLTGFLQSTLGRTRIANFVTRGVSQANVNASNLKKVVVPVPPLDEQARVVASWARTRQVQRGINAHLESTWRLCRVLRETLLRGDCDV